MPLIDLAPLASAAELFDRLAADGWRIDEDDFIAIAEIETASPSAGIRALQPLGDAIVSASAIALISSQSFRLMRTSNGTLEVAATPTFPAGDAFSEGLLPTAESAWEGNVEDAEALGLTWAVACQLDLARLIDVGPNSAKVALRAATIESTFASAALEDLKRLVPATDRRIYISMDGSELQLDAGAVTVLSLATSDREASVPQRIPDLDGETRSRPSAETPSPTSLAPLEDGTNWPGVRLALTRGAAAATWVYLADDYNAGQVEYFGFKRVRFDLPSLHDWAPVALESTGRLRRWAFSDRSPDRLLALRQVISLYDAPGPFDSADEVRFSAEPIYIGLRSEAVAEVVRSSREAQAHALEVVRQTLDVTQTTLKSTVERAVAGAIAVAAAVMANVSAVLPADVTNWLLAAVGAYYLVMLAVFLVVESPSLSLPLKNLDDDLRRGLGLLTDQRRSEFVDSGSVRATRTRVAVARVAIVLLYSIATLSIATLVFNRIDAF
jgi:hypothetical protein